MTPYRWNIAGWAFLIATVVLGVVSAVLALDAVSGVRLLVPGISIVGPVGYSPVEFLSGVICGVLAGMTFFSGLACFFWSALLTSRRQLARILESIRAAG